MTLTIFPGAAQVSWREAQSSQPASTPPFRAPRMLGLGEGYQFYRKALRPADWLNAISEVADNQGAEAALDPRSGAPPRLWVIDRAAP